MKILNDRKHEFEIVEIIPIGYEIWNIGSNMVDGYLPLCEISSNIQINASTLKAIKVQNAEVVMVIVGYLKNKNIKGMETYIKKYAKSKSSHVIWKIERMKRAVEILKTVKGVENL